MPAIVGISLVLVLVGSVVTVSVVLDDATVAATVAAAAGYAISRSSDQENRQHLTCSR